MTTISLETPTISVQRGDLWQLGVHRLLCGDATNAEDVTRLLQGKSIDLVVTSPPYAHQRTYGLASFDWQALMDTVFDHITAHTATDAQILVNLGLVHRQRKVDLYWLSWLAHCESVGWPLFGWYVWDKREALAGDWGGRLAPAHEFLFHFSQHRKGPIKWVETKYTERTRQRKQQTALRGYDDKVDQVNSPDKYGQSFKIPDSVIRLNPQKGRDAFTKQHPAVFPVTLPEYVMRTWSNPGDIVYEPFCGSGSTMIAAQNVDRRCYALDINPDYCALAIARYEAATGNKVQRIERAAS